MARGRAVGTNERENWNSNSPSILISRPLPASSSTYIQRNCKRRIMSTIKNVSTSGPINDFMTNLSIVFTLKMNLIAKLLDFYQKCFDFVHFLVVGWIREIERMA